MEKDLGKPLATGRTAEIYSWQADHVLKLYHDWFDLESIEAEQKMAQSVHASGLAVPAVGELVQVNGRNGLIYQRVAGADMWDAIQKQPWRTATFAHQMAELHSWMHTVDIQPDLPSQRHRLEKKIQAAESLPVDLKKTVLNSLASLPDGSALCHGDFHPGNILIDRHQAVIIDWIDASRGNPLADVARSTVIILGAAATSQIPNPAIKFIIRLFHTVYLRHYFRLRPGGEKEYRRWLPVIAAARLSENIPELKDWLVCQSSRD